MLRDEEVTAACLCNVSLESMGWTNDGREMAFAIDFDTCKRAPSRRMTLHCRSAHALQVDMRHADRRGGMPLSWDATFERDEDGWVVSLDFASEGHISLKCSEVELIETV